MDNTAINRSGREKLFNLIDKSKFRDMMDRVNNFTKESPHVPLSPAECLLFDLSQTQGLLDSLKLWRIRDDCETMERDICEPLNAIMATIRFLKNSKELGHLLGVTLKVINLMKGQQFTALKIQDLHKLETVKDNTRTNTLLYHIVRKVLQEDPTFQGFPPDVLMKLNLIADTSLASLDEKIALMESGCRLNSQMKCTFYVIGSYREF